MAVVSHEEKLAALHGDDPRSLLSAAVEARGWPEPRWYSTSAADAGAGAARTALDDGARLVVVCGGDGTANACAAILAGTGVPMALIPAGTGNIIAANLGIPSEPAEAVRVALAGHDRRIDVGRLAAENGADGQPGGAVMVAFAGSGLDAAMVQDAPHWMKRRLGWASYAVALIRHLPDHAFGVVVDVDGQRTRHRAVRTVVVGNLASLQGGLTLFPDVSPDDGQLHVAVIAPASLPAWIAAVADLLGRRRKPTDAVQRFRGRRIVVTSRRPLRREADGEPLPDGPALDVRVEPGALLIRTDPENADNPRNGTGG